MCTCSPFQRSRWHTWSITDLLFKCVVAAVWAAVGPLRPADECWIEFMPRLGLCCALFCFLPPFTSISSFSNNLYVWTKSIFSSGPAGTAWMFLCGCPTDCDQHTGLGVEDLSLCVGSGVSVWWGGDVAEGACTLLRPLLAPSGPLRAVT